MVYFCFWNEFAWCCVQYMSIVEFTDCAIQVVYVLTDFLSVFSLYYWFKWIKISHNEKNQIHILLKYSWNFIQDRSYLGHKTIPNKFSKTEIIKVSSPTTINEARSRRKTGKQGNTWKLSNVFLNDQCVKAITREIIKYFEMNENRSTTCQDLWDVSRAALREEFIVWKHTLERES